MNDPADKRGHGVLTAVFKIQDTFFGKKLCAISARLCKNSLKMMLILQVDIANHKDTKSLKSDFLNRKVR